MFGFRSHSYPTFTRNRLPNAGNAVAGALIAGGVIVGALFAGRALRRKRLRARTPYEFYKPARRKESGDYEAVGI